MHHMTHKYVFAILNKLHANEFTHRYILTFFCVKIFSFFKKSFVLLTKRYTNEKRPKIIVHQMYSIWLSRDRGEVGIKNTLRSYI